MTYLSGKGGTTYPHKNTVFFLLLIWKHSDIFYLWHVKQIFGMIYCMYAFNLLFDKQKIQVGPTQVWQNYFFKTEIQYYKYFSSIGLKMLPVIQSLHCTILALIFTRQQVLWNRRQMPEIGGKSVLVHMSDSPAVLIINNLIISKKETFMYRVSADMNKFKTLRHF